MEGKIDTSAEHEEHSLEMNIFISFFADIGHVFFSFFTNEI